MMYPVGVREIRPKFNIDLISLFVSFDEIRVSSYLLVKEVKF